MIVLQLIRVPKPRIPPIACCPAAQWSGRSRNVVSQFRAAVTFCPAFRRPPGKARPDWESFAAVWTAAGFEPSSSPTTSAAESSQSSQTSAGRLYDFLPALSTAATGQPRPAAMPAPKGTRTNWTGKRNASTPICSFPTANAAPCSAVLYSRWPGQSRSRGLSPCTHCWGYLGQWQHDDPHGPGSIGWWAMPPSLCEMHAGGPAP